MPPPAQPLSNDENAAQPPEQRVHDLLDFVLRYEADRSRGELRTLAEYQGLFPHAAEIVAEEFHRLQTDASESDFLEQAKKLPRIDHYILEREIGRGGQGRVFLALDTRIRRRVALKVLDRANISPDTLRRFQREVEVIAKLDHPGLCSVFEANLHGSRPYLAMRYVEGDDLARQISQAKSQGAASGIVGARTTVDLAQLLQLFERAARALHAAHEVGVIHRDVKPANILVRPTGEPVIVDFGLARDEDPEADALTQVADVLGTPAYMAPELIDSGHSSVDRRADVYALGIALYECLTLERPFAGATRESVFDQIRLGVYANPSEHNPLVGEDLRVVLATAMELDPVRRYASALDFAEDLRRVREYEPIRARPAKWPLRSRRWVQRHPQLAASFALVVVFVVGALVTLTATVRRVEAESARTRAANERLLGVAFREKADTALGSNAGLALRLALEAEKRDPCFESNMTLLRALESSHEQRTLLPMPRRQAIYDVATCKGGVVATTGAALHFFDTDKPDPWLVVPANVSEPKHLQVSSDGSRIAVLGEEFVQVFDGVSGTPLYAVSLDSKSVDCCQFSPDSRWLVTGARNGVARVLEARDGALLRTLKPGTGTITLTHFDRSGQRLVTATDGRRDSGAVPASDFDPRLWNASTGELLGVLTGHSSGTREALFTADGKRLVTICTDGSVRCWMTDDAQLAWRKVVPGEGWSLDVSPDGRQVVAGFESGARVFDVASGDTLFDLDGLHERSVLHVAFSPNGRHIATMDYGGGLGAWDASDGANLMKARCETTGPGSLTWLPDSTRFVTSAGREVVHVWTTLPIPLLTGWHSHTQRVRSCVFSPSSELVLSAGEDGLIELRRSIDGTLLRRWTFNGPLERAWFVGENTAIACLLRDGRVFRIEGETNPLRAAESHASVRSSEVSGDGSTVLVGLSNGRVVWLDVRDGRQLLATCNGEVEVNVLAISRNGLRAAWCSDDGAGGATEWRSERILTFHLDAAYQHMHALAFDADGANILANGNAAGGKSIQFDDGVQRTSSLARPISALAPLRGLRTLAAYKWVAGVCLSDDASGTLVWQTGQYGTPGRFVTLRVNATEDLAVVGSTAGSAQLFRVQDGQIIVRYEHGSSPLTCAEFSPDGRAVVTAAEDGSVRVWPVDLTGTASAHVPASADVWQSRFPKSLDRE